MSTSSIEKQQRWTQTIGRISFVTGMAAALMIWLWPHSELTTPIAQAIRHNSESLISYSSSTSRLPVDHDTKPIEQIRVGDRVLAHNPEVTDEERESWTEPDWSQWIKLTLLMPKEDGSELKMELLRSEDWVRSQISYVFDEVQLSFDEQRKLELELVRETSPTYETADTELSVPLSPLRPVFRDFAIAGAQAELTGLELSALLVEMDLPELAITGPAAVIDIEPVPYVQSGAGEVVTATFHHSSGDIIDLAIGTATDHETIGTTSNHPFWSVDRQDYVQAGTLELGERVQTYYGDTKRVVSKLPRPGPEPVFNMEVHGEHVYYVGEHGFLVHNASTKYAGGGVGKKLQKDKGEFGSFGDFMRHEYGRIRRASPSDEIQDMVNPAARRGPHTDPALGEGFVDDVLEADHIVSLKEIYFMPGFRNLSFEHQKQVANFPRNFIGLVKSANASKGANSWTKWWGHKISGTPVKPSFRQKMIKKERKVRAQLQMLINDLSSQ